MAEKEKNIQLIKAQQFGKRIRKVASGNDIFFNASAITFNLFICVIPFVLILISIIGYVLSYDEAYQELLRYGEELLPQFSYEANPDDVFAGTNAIENILRPLVGARTVFGIVGFSILLFFTQGLLHSVKHVMFDIFGIQDRAHPVIQVIYNFFAVGVISTVFLFFSLSFSIISLFDFNEFTVPFTDIVIRLSWIYEFLNVVIPIVFTFFLQFAIFRYISERKIRPKVALIGALTYTIMFEIAKFIVSNYLLYAFSAYRYFYQGYAILIVIGIWTFYSALLFVISAIIAKAYADTYLKPVPRMEINPYTAIS